MSLPEAKLPEGQEEVLDEIYCEGVAMVFSSTHLTTNRGVMLNFYLSGTLMYFQDLVQHLSCNNCL